MAKTKTVKAWGLKCKDRGLLSATYRYEKEAKDNCFHCDKPVRVEIKEVKNGKG